MESLKIEFKTLAKALLLLRLVRQSQSLKSSENKNYFIFKTFITFIMQPWHLRFDRKRYLFLVAFVVSVWIAFFVFRNKK